MILSTSTSVDGLSPMLNSCIWWVSFHIYKIVSLRTRRHVELAKITQCVSRTYQTRKPGPAIQRVGISRRSKVPSPITYDNDLLLMQYAACCAQNVDSAPVYRRCLS